MWKCGTSKSRSGGKKNFPNLEPGNHDILVLKTNKTPGPS